MSYTPSAHERAQPIKYNDLIGYNAGDMTETVKTYQHAHFIISFSWNWKLARSISDSKQGLYVSNSPVNANMSEWEMMCVLLGR